MQIIRTITALQHRAKNWRQTGGRIGFVPTLGYLHAGHMSLVRRARQAVGKNGKVVVSIYVNPTQFAPTEDLAKYPRDWKRDCRLCRAAGVDAVFAPDDAEMYWEGRRVGVPKNRDGGTPSLPPSFSTYVVEEQLARVMEGAARPAHFRGVTTVVAKLFNIVLPNVAVFGAKDWQQAAIIRRMIADLNFPVKLIVAPTTREVDGLALSSRNKYLDAEQRAQAVILFHALQAAKAAVKRKAISAARLKKDLQEFLTAAPLARLDYVEFFEPDTLQPVATVRHGAHMALAVFFGKTRLIDNGRL